MGIVDAFIRSALERIHTKICNHRCTQYCIRIFPYSNSMGILAEEGDLPVVVPQGCDATVVGPIEKLFARPLVGLPLECWQQVVAIEMDLVGPITDFLALQQILFLPCYLLLTNMTSMDSFCTA